MKVAFLGLGVMGAPMAGHLAKAGHEVRVWNRTRAKATSWMEAHDGVAATVPEEAVGDAEQVFMCLGDDPDVQMVADAIAPALMPNTILVDHTTASPALAQRLHEKFARQDVRFVDAPVSGGQAGAQSGRLSVMCGGDADAVEAAYEVMTAYAARIIHIGPSGHGQLAKAVNQICIAGLVQGLSEGIHFAQSAGLDIAKTIEAVSGGAAQSWQMDNRAHTMSAGEFDFGFAVDWMRKDLRIALEEARAVGATLPVTSLVDQFYADVQTSGGGRFDTSSLITRLKK